MSIINNGLLLASGADAAVGYQISRSLRFNSADSAYLSRTPASAGNRKTWTWSGWVKRSAINSRYSLFVAATGGNNQTEFFFEQATGADTLHFYHYDNAYLGQCRTVAVFRDTSAWYHIVLAVDTTQATASNRCKIYVNGVQQDTTFTTNFTQNADLYVNATNAHAIGYDVGNAPSQPYYFSGYLADIYFLDGTATTPSTFAETDAITGQWVPKTPTGISYGTNGFRLPFSDNSGTTSTTLGKDAAGSNNWTPNNFSVASGSGNDSLVDTPTSYGTDTGAGGEVRGNYATFNPLNVQLGAGSLSNGNLDLTGPSGSSAYNFAGGTFGIDTSTSTGWYFEFTQTTYGQYASIALLDQSVSASALNNLYIIGHSFANGTAGVSYNNGGSIANYGTVTTGLTSWTSSGDVIGVAIKDNKIWFAKNNTWISGSPSAGTSPSITLASTKYVTPAAIGINSSVLSLNAGQRPFAYTAPSGFKALCDTNLTAPTIAKPANYFDVKLYTGNGSTQTISGLGFSPDLVWAKSRSSAAGHGLFDSVRGVSKSLSSHVTEAEGVGAAGTGVSAFNSDGFSLGPYDAAFAGNINPSGSSQVAWCWDAGTSTVTNTQGSITSSVRANASAGFSICTFTTQASGSGQTVGHGLGVAPSLIIQKIRNVGGSSWFVYHTSLGAGNYILFDTSASVASSTAWNSTSPTSSVWSLGSTWAGSYSAVAYCWTPVTGYSSFGSYTGNGSSDGPFVFTGFRPRWVMIKGSSYGSNWNIIDAARDPYNLQSNKLRPNASSAESSEPTGQFAICWDALSNGFKLRGGGGINDVNQTNETLIWAAFAESPFQYSRAR